MTGFDEIDDSDFKAPEALKDMLVSEIDVIRDTMTFVNMFLGEPFMVCLKSLQELEQKNS
ncbi:hypothetical protein [Lacihabitans lacunae]|jgi:hypothetical protein|uniref:Uncharacterized protein n=1 Tax=Lacihabitans lacunae TaxID=1028214 RepID=A0ABV7Z013_9BACT